MYDSLSREELIELIEKLKVIAIELIDENIGLEEELFQMSSFEDLLELYEDEIS